WQPGANGQYLQGGTGVPPPYWSALDLDGGQNGGGLPPLAPSTKYSVPGEKRSNYPNSWYNVFPYYSANNTAPYPLAAPCVLSFAPKAAGSAQGSLLVTTDSFDFDRPGLLPWLPQPAAGTTNGYSMGAGARYPSGPTVAFTPAPNIPTAGEFGADRRGVHPQN